MERIARLITGLMVAAAALSPFSAVAGPKSCKQDIVVFSYLQGAGAVNSNYVACTAESLAPTETEHDGRIINPAHDMISVRYLKAVRRDPATIWAKLSGLGFDGRWVVLERVEVETGSWVYDQMTPVALKDGSAASGCLRVTVSHVEERTKRTRSGDVKTIREVIVNDRTAFHTIDASC